jgi:hypothetical protein
MPSEQAAKLVEQVKDAHHHLLVALKYTPDDRLDWVPMGKAKTPREIAVECAMVYKGVVSLIRGGTIDAPAQEMEPGDQATREGLLKLLDDSLQEFVAAAEGLTQEQLGEKRQAPWAEDTVAGLLGKTQFHTIWHVGQLNYIQALWGDADMHWE